MKKVLLCFFLVAQAFGEIDKEAFLEENKKAWAQIRKEFPGCMSGDNKKATLAIVAKWDV